MDELKRKYKKLYGRMPHHTWDSKKIQSKIDEKGAVQEVEVPEIDPIKPEPEAPAPAMDPMLLQLLAGQQAILGKVVESLDQIKEGMKDLKPLTPDEAKKEFDDSLKTTHFENEYRYEVYALKYKAPDGSEERGLTGKVFTSEDEGQKYGMEHFGAAKYKLLRTKIPRLVKNKETAPTTKPEII